MAFVVEDGTGVSDANSYTSVAFYRAYFTDRGRDVSAQTDQQIQGFLVRATDFIEKRFGDRWRGSRSTLTQALGFPRTGVVVDGSTLGSDVVPLMLQSATAEYGYRASLYAELAPDPPVPFDRQDNDGGTVSGGGAVIEKNERVGPIAEGTVYADPTAASNTWTMPSYPAADLLLQPLLTGGGRGRTIRA